MKRLRRITASTEMNERTFTVAEVVEILSVIEELQGKQVLSEVSPDGTVSFRVGEYLYLF